MQTHIWISFEFEAWHCWPDAPTECGYLAARHRHLFKCRAWWPVSHGDRDIEFIGQKHQAVAVVESLKAQAETWSCEQWASRLLGELGASKVEVSEDGENGATVEN